jgi:hypothetical protein
MYYILITIIFIIIIIFLVYNFFPVLDKFIKKLLPNQKVSSIKYDMKILDENPVKNQESELESELEPESKIEIIYRKFEEFLYIPIDLMNKVLITFLPNLGN